jgi:hypothetical protein
VAPPAAVLAAAEAAPPAFEIAAYYQAIRLMREKGNSWRGLAEWLKEFNIEISYVHLRRLFRREQDRLTRTGEEQPASLGVRATAALMREDEKDWTLL